jgi:hypothetical protein
MRRRSSATQAPTPAHARTRRLASAASIVPLAIGLASTGVQSGHTPTGQSSNGQEMVQKGSFSPVCSLPFVGVRNPPADDHCGIQGGNSDPAKIAESTAKNNFCASTGNPETITYQQLINLQAQSSNIPKNLSDRKEVENLGEGSYVSYVAVIKEAHYSDVTSGEAVNCNIPGNATNDIHIVLMADPTDTDECHSTTAEMSPHYRPANWTPATLNAIKTPIRVRGQLFYDNSHVPCSGNSRPNPKRASLWEIHPVYSLEVCKNPDLNHCRNSNDPTDWSPSK